MITRLAILILVMPMSGSARATPASQAVAIGAEIPGAVAGTEPLEIDFCQFWVRPGIETTPTDFSAKFSFEVGKNGGPVDIIDRTHLTRADALRWGWREEFITISSPNSPWIEWTLDESFMITCLSGWRFPRIPIGTRLTAEFKWDHRLGWTALQVTGDGINYKIRIKR